MNMLQDKLQRAYDSVKERVPFQPKVALVLGSGLGDYAETMDVVETISYHDIAAFPTSTAPGHKGCYVFGYVDGVPIVAMQGRVHFYEGYDMSDVVLPIRLMGLMGAEILFLTNAAGGMQQGMKAGDLMLIKDQISFFVPSPLRGANVPELGVRFPDMSHLYDPELQHLVKKTAMDLDIELKEGVYIQTKGPQYETPAEVNLCRLMGADAVGMSTACEAIAGHHMGMKVVGVSCIANLAAGISPTPLSEQEVIDAAKAVAPKFTSLVTKSIQEM